MHTINIVQIVVTALLTIGGMIPVTKKVVQKWGPAIRAAEPAVASFVDNVVHDAETALKSPELAPLALKAHHLTSEIKDSRVVQYAGLALHAYEKGFDNLAPDEKATAVLLVKSELKKLGYDVSDNEVFSALQTAQKISNDFKNSQTFQVTQQLVAAKQSLTAPAQTASA